MKSIATSCLQQKHGANSTCVKSPAMASIFAFLWMQTDTMLVRTPKTQMFLVPTGRLRQYRRQLSVRNFFRGLTKSPNSNLPGSSAFSDSPTLWHPVKNPCAAMIMENRRKFWHQGATTTATPTSRITAPWNTCWFRRSTTLPAARQPVTIPAALRCETCVMYISVRFSGVQPFRIQGAGLMALTYSSEEYRL